MMRLHNLSVGYGQIPVLSALDLEFRPGEILVLAGPNGCGKSTLLRTAAGLLPPLAGEIQLDGQPLSAWSLRQRAQRTAYLAQSRPVPNITGCRMVLHGRFPYLGYPRRYRPEDHAAVRQALEQADALDLAQRPLPALSGGQRQKIYLAMALAQDADTVLLDEPTTYLDIRHQLDVMHTAAQLAARGKAVVLVLHDLCLALSSAHRLAVLDGGRLQCVGSPQTVFASGVLDRVFQVPIRRTQTAAGWRYYYE